MQRHTAVFPHPKIWWKTAFRRKKFGGKRHSGKKNLVGAENQPILHETESLWNITENIIYDKLLNDKLSTNLGYVYENVIAQMLRATGKNLFYHTIPFAEGKKYYEIDFVIPEKHKISPIEVKSSGYKTHKSLDEFCCKFSDRIQNKYLIYTKDLKRENGINYIPVYMTMFL